ncbi:probable cytochrome P450 313a4 [Malaya genurostris]|uniref:probable cytochrome P450 313a4 n=1 Tax=Malaya genurostris TaxID=325434 RepID=UPI0026F3A5D8|nr:probable cytochrome P450 313a4 [Malaya genurostris]
MVGFFGQIDRLGKLMLGPLFPILIVNHPDLVQEVLTQRDICDKPFLYDFLGLEAGLIALRSGEKWRRVRKLLNPTFNTKMLTSFLPIMGLRASKMIAKLRPLADGHTDIDIVQFIGECTLEMIFNTTMARDANELPGQRDYIRNLEIIQNTIGKRALNANQYLGVLYRISRAYETEHIARGYCNEIADKIITERRKELDETLTESEVDENEFHTKTLNFLDRLLEIQKENNLIFSDSEISDHLHTIMAAGYDTSSLTVAYSCLFLAMHPDIQHKVRNEMNEVFHSSSVDISNETLKQLEYTEMVIKEVLRMCPTAPIIARQTANEIELDGIRIPKGQIIAINFFTLHRRKDIWGPDPEHFNPERFRPETTEGRHPFAYLPFSGGLRYCIGSRYAMNSMRILLLKIVQNFEIQTDLRYTDLKFKYEISLKLAGPHSVRLVKLNKS